MKERERKKSTQEGTKQKAASPTVSGKDGGELFSWLGALEKEVISIEIPTEKRETT